MKKFIKNNFSNKNNGESKKSDFEENFKPQDFVDYSAIGIFKLNVDAGIEYANQTLAQILEFKSRSDLIGINFKDELVSESTDWEKLRAKLYKHRIAKNFIIPLKQNSGASIFVRVDIRAASDEKGDPTHFEGSVTDVSEFVQSQNQVQRELQALKEGKETTAPIPVSPPSVNNKHLSGTVRKLKTPLNSIIGFLTLIEQGFFNSEEELKDFSHKARVSANSLIGAIDGIAEDLNKDLTEDSNEEDISIIAEKDKSTCTEEISSELKEDSETEQPQETEERTIDQSNEVSENNSPPPSDGKKILLVEDNPISQSVEMRLLEDSGYSVMAVTNGEDAIEAVKTDQFSLVLMDVEMPGMDGIKATKMIRKLDSAISQIPIIAVTAHSSMKDREKCLSSGMNDYIAKPININFMKMTIDQWLKRKVEI